MKKIIYTTSFKKHYSHLNPSIRDIVFEKIELLARENEFLDIKKLEPKHEWIRRLRIGKYRIIFEYINTTTIKLLKVDSRDSVYK